MSHRERCFPKLFSRIWWHLGLPGGSQIPAKASPAEPQLVLPPFPKQRHSEQVYGDSAAADKKMPVGFRVRVSMPTAKLQEPFTPVVVECTPGSGGVQGLHWYSEKLMVDEDGDVAQEFLDEVVSQSSGTHFEYPRVHPSFRLKMKTSAVKLKGQVGTDEGNLVQILSHT